MKVLDLFSGIGGFSLGLERTGGFETVAFCEIEEFPRRVLAKHWPGVPIHRDVRELKAEHVGAVDVICGGFPCQDISSAGKGAGIAGKRSGLWSEYARLIGEIRPRYVIVENVAALLGRGMGVVLGDLAALGYDAEWRRISAFDVGAPHLRQRIWIVAYPSDGGQRLIFQSIEQPWGGPSPDAGCDGEVQPLADASRLQPGRQEQRPLGQRTRSGGKSQPVANAQRLGCEQVVASVACRADCEGPANPTADAGIAAGRGWWLVEPDVGRVAHGVPARVDRLRGLGNAVVPQIPEIIGRAIIAAEHRTRPA